MEICDYFCVTVFVSVCVNILTFEGNFINVFLFALNNFSFVPSHVVLRADWLY